MKDLLRQLWLKNFLSLFPYRFKSPGGLRVDCRRRYEIRMCEAHLVKRYYPLDLVRGPVRTVLDLGANIGLFSLTCIERFGDEVQQIVAVEPARRTFRQLRRNIALNNLQERITAVNEAVQAAPGYGELRIRHAHYSYSMEAAKIEDPRSLQRVKVTTLDELKRRYAMDVIDLMKIDVEGSELAVLDGGQELLKSVRTLIVEAHAGFCRRSDLVRVLSPFGFVLLPWADSLERDDGDFCFVRPA